jgi:hypothetical protein
MVFVAALIVATVAGALHKNSARHKCSRGPVGAGFKPVAG